MDDQSTLTTVLFRVTDPFNTIEEAQSVLDLDVDNEFHGPNIHFAFIYPYTHTIWVYAFDTEPSQPPPAGWRRNIARLPSGTRS